MKKEHVEAIFLLAGISISSMEKIDNQYWPSNPAYAEERAHSPWWLVTTSKGVLVIGWRKKVIHIDWSNAGIVFPLIHIGDQKYLSDTHIIRNNNTKWATGGHAYGHGEAVQILKGLKDISGRSEYLKRHWAENPTKDVDKKEWLISGNRNDWVKEGEDHLEVTIAEANPTFALEIFHRLYPGYSINWINLKEEMMASRREFEERHPTLV